MMERQMKFCSPKDISGALKQNSIIIELSQTTETVDT